MPKIAGSPVTISNGQPQREVSHFNVSVSYDTAGVATFTFNAFGTLRLRAADGTLIHEDEQKQFLSLADAQLPSNVKTALIAVVAKLDTL
jgi:hypothetical protein